MDYKDTDTEVYRYLFRGEDEWLVRVYREWDSGCESSMSGDGYPSHWCVGEVELVAVNDVPCEPKEIHVNDLTDKEYDSFQYDN